MSTRIKDKLSIERRSSSSLKVTLPIDTEGIDHVVLNGVVFYVKGSIAQVVRVAPIIYLDLHFQQVNWLVEKKHYSKEAAIEEVANNNGFEKDNFRRRYYGRKGSLMGMEEPQ